MFHFFPLSNPALTQTQRCARTHTHAHTNCSQEAFSGHHRDTQKNASYSLEVPPPTPIFLAFKFPFSQLELSICKYLTFISLQINTRAVYIKQSINSCWPVLRISIKGKSSEEVHSQDLIKSLMLQQLWMVVQNNNLGG